MRALVIDDEPLVRTALAKLLARRADIDEFEVAEDAIQALAHLGKRPFDVLLVDIHMPEMSGLQLIEHLSKQSGPMPSVIFITAYHEYAVEAFEKRAVDYVLKPFVPARLHDALDVAVRRSGQERAERLLGMLKDLKLRPDHSSRIAIKDKGRVVFVDVAEITSVEANGNYVLLQQKAGSYLLRETIGEIAGKLKPHGFIRIHRSVLVNSRFVESLEPGVGSEYVLRTKTGKEYHVTRTFRGNLRDLAEFWIGSEAFHIG
ncbi:MAG: LytR/AlgR family response regulator transcription factor [Steroidobacteraceae bacterium]